MIDILYFFKLKELTETFLFTGMSPNLRWIHKLYNKHSIE